MESTCEAREHESRSVRSSRNSYCPFGQAVPLVHFKLEGRLQGSDDAFANSVQVSLGEVVEYRLRMQMAFPGEFNSNFQRWDYEPDRHGMNSLSIDMVQSSIDPIQIDLMSPVELRSDPYGRGWDQGTGARGGRPTVRTGSPYNDLLDVRPIHSAGVFTGTHEETVFAGLFNVEAITGLSGEVRAEWGRWSGGGWFDEYVLFILGPKVQDSNNVPLGQRSTEVSFDPFAEFAPLTLTAPQAPVPEPSSIVLSAVAIGSFLIFTRRLLVHRKG